MRAWLLFSALRLLVFAVPFGILYAVGVPWWVAALLAAAIGFCVSYILLRPLRDKVAIQVAEARAATAARGVDEDAEDAPPAG